MTRIVVIHALVCIAVAATTPPWFSVPVIIAATGIAISVLRRA